MFYIGEQKMIYYMETDIVPSPFIMHVVVPDRTFTSTMNELCAAQKRLLSNTDILKDLVSLWLNWMGKKHEESLFDANYLYESLDSVRWVFVRTWKFNTPFYKGQRLLGQVPGGVNPFGTGAPWLGTRLKLVGSTGPVGRLQPRCRYISLRCLSLSAMIFVY